MHEILHDKSPFGGERHWPYYKQMNIKLADYADAFNWKLAEKIRACSTYLEFKRNPNTGYLRLYRTYYCHNKLCYLCNWRRSLKNFHELKLVLNQTDKEQPGCRFIFLTLTAKDSTGSELKNNVKNMNHAVSKLFNYSKVKKFLVGYVRSTEITVTNGVKTDEIMYHHHVHVIAMVNNYFKKGNYMNHDEWTDLWKLALKTDYTPIINVKAIKANHKKHLTAIDSASRELSKYVVKPSSYLAESDDGFQSKSDADEHNINVIKCLSEQLYNVRQTSYGGLLRKVRSQMFGAEKDDEDLTHISDGDSEFNSDEAETVKAYWNDFNDNYYIINPNKGV
ncbi:hypothetical protein AKUG0803_UNKNOWN200040 (plasmid) [Apilactobacillus kunkeei]|nr:hypothetical protein AKUG0804_UNKNOWN200040 [Apilactobacillus kunkeei]CAI2672474.1 hypothetical protein AKUG0405_UNKNOWN200040 [Apilactobacillus kunkeei]CAI2674211.1 hypothetical protein AKUG0103_UNKNOWN200040 [Apilactobacillus kunkeei]CAI2674765.1 hypothetical protein AKUG0803_UNKNOWN200040 [Apilactobacillus kunkeei]CAI2676620.1 hypothetical protein AKUG0402_UNKNOWN200040 [Apilactobacillus kunkeei]